MHSKQCHCCLHVKIFPLPYQRYPWFKVAALARVQNPNSSPLCDIVFSRVAFFWNPPQHYVGNSPFRWPTRPEGQRWAKLWKLRCSVEVSTEDTTSVSGDKYQYMPRAVKIRERHGPPYITEYSVVHPEEHSNKPPSSTRKSQSPDFQILTAVDGKIIRKLWCFLLLTFRVLYRKTNRIARQGRTTFIFRKPSDLPVHFQRSYLSIRVCSI